VIQLANTGKRDRVSLLDWVSFLPCWSKINNCAVDLDISQGPVSGCWMYETSAGADLEVEL
jgi:hypothetical protein